MAGHYYAPGDDPAYEFQAMVNDSNFIRSYDKTYVVPLLIPIRPA